MGSTRWMYGKHLWSPNQWLGSYSRAGGYNLLGIIKQTKRTWKVGVGPPGLYQLVPNCGSLKNLLKGDSDELSSSSLFHLSFKWPVTKQKKQIVVNEIRTQHILVHFYNGCNWPQNIQKLKDKIAPNWTMYFSLFCWFGKTNSGWR